MACGVTKSWPAYGTLTCNNAGTSAHAGNHTCTVTFSMFDRVWSAVSISWGGSDAVACRQKALTVGDGAL